MDSKKKFQIFIVICVVAVVGGLLSTKFMGVKEASDEVACFANIRRLEGIAVILRSENKPVPLGLIDEEGKKIFGSHFNEGFPNCVKGGTFSITNRGRIVCSVHGTYDKSQFQAQDFLPIEIKAPEKVIEEIVYKEPPKPTEIPEFERLFTEGKNLAYSNNHPSAILCFIQASRLEPKRLDVLFALAESYTKSAHIPQAKEIYDKILSLEPDNQQAQRLSIELESREYFRMRLANRYTKGWGIFYISWSKDQGRDTICGINVDGSSYNPVLENLNGAYFQILSGENRLIVSEDGKIYEVDMTGQNKMEIFDNSRYPISQFLVSPDEKYIAFISPKTSRNHELYMLRPEIGEALALTGNQGNCGDLGWSHHGREVIFTIYRGKEDSDIFISRAEGKNLVPLTNDGLGNSQPHWHESRSFIVYSSRSYPEGTPIASAGRKDRDIWSMSGMGTNKKQLTKTPDIDEFGPRLSPNGNQIAFFGDNQGIVEIYSCDAEGKNRKKLTNFNKKVGSAWSFGEKIEWFPDETLILFSAGPSDNRDLYILEISSGKYTVIASGPVHDDYPTLLYPGRKKAQQKTLRPLN